MQIHGPDKFITEACRFMETAPTPSSSPAFELEDLQALKTLVETATAEQLMPRCQTNHEIGADTDPKTSPCTRLAPVLPSQLP